MVKMLVPSLWGDLRTVTSTMVKYGVKAKEVFGLIMDLLQGTAAAWSIFFQNSNFRRQLNVHTVTTKMQHFAEEEGKRKAAMKEFDEFDAKKRHTNGSEPKEIAVSTLL